MKCQRALKRPDVPCEELSSLSQHAIDESSLLSVEQVRALLGCIEGESPGEGFPFLAFMAGTALPPGEAVSVRVDDVMLPGGEFGEVLGSLGRGPEGSCCMGKRGDAEALDRHADLEGWRQCCSLVNGVGSFPASAYRREWRQARLAVLNPKEAQAGLGGAVLQPV